MSLSGLRGGFTTVDGVRVYARSAVDQDASKPTIILIHGVGLSSRYMIPLARHLRADFQVYALDLPGFGRSDKARDAPTVRQQTDDLRAFMDAVGIERASLLGNSLGSQVAIDFAYRHPERTEKLVLVGSSPDPRARNPVKMYAWQLMNMPLEPLPMQAIYALDYAQTGLIRMFKTMSRTCDDPIEDKLPSISAEALVVRGRHDQVVPQRWAEHVARLLPRGRLVVVRGAAHCAHFSRAGEVARLVREFIPRMAPSRVQQPVTTVVA